MRLHIRCEDGACMQQQRRKRHWGFTFTAAEAVEWWGAETTFEEIRRRGVCSFCGRKGQMVTEVSPIGHMPGASGGMG